MNKDYYYYYYYHYYYYYYYTQIGRTWLQYMLVIFPILVRHVCIMIMLLLYKSINILTYIYIVGDWNITHKRTQTVNKPISL